jgi:cell wall-associated NlpC family hydrolase
MSIRPNRPAAALLTLAFACATASAMDAQAKDRADSLAASAVETARKTWTGAQDVAMYSLGLIGVVYKFGGNTPESGLDCSGLVRYVFQEVTGVTLPRTAKALSGLGARVSAADLQPGDLVFFNTRRFAYSHVGIYLGDNRFIHARSRGADVEVSQLSQSYWQKHFNGARRLVGVLPSLVPSVISPALAETIPTAADRAVEPSTVIERAAETP